jgi:hypothetical protein
MYYFWEVVILTKRLLFALFGWLFAETPVLRALSLTAIALLAQVCNVFFFFFFFFLNHVFNFRFPTETRSQRLHRNRSATTTKIASLSVTSPICLVSSSDWLLVSVCCWFSCRNDTRFGCRRLWYAAALLKNSRCFAHGFAFVAFQFNYFDDTEQIDLYNVRVAIFFAFLVVNNATAENRQRCDYVCGRDDRRDGRAESCECATHSRRFCSPVARCASSTLNKHRIAMNEFAECIVLNSLNLVNSNLSDCWRLQENPFDLAEPYIEQVPSSAASIASDQHDDRKRRKITASSEDINLRYAHVHHESIRNKFNRALEFLQPRTLLLHQSAPVGMQTSSSATNSTVAPPLLLFSSTPSGDSNMLRVVNMQGDLCVRSVHRLFVCNSTATPLSLFVRSSVEFQRGSRTANDASSDNNVDNSSGGCCEEFLIPSLSRFLNSDIGNVSSLLAGLMQQPIVSSGANVVVIDIPWENQSVTRGRKYASMAPHEIRQLPLAPPVLTDSDDAFVVFWLTNKEANRRFIVNCLGSFNLVYVTTWYWLKVTNGKCVLCVARGQQA